jgi:hypothetical protein
VLAAIRHGWRSGRPPGTCCAFPPILS